MVNIGQEEVLKVLEKEKRPLGRKDIAERLGQTGETVSHHLKKLLIHNEIKCIVLDRNQAKEFFKCSRSHRTKVYYV